MGDPAQSYAEGPIVVADGTCGQLTIYAVDKNGQPYVDRPHCILKMKGPNGTIRVSGKYNKKIPGSFLAEYAHPLPSGTYTIEILLDKDHISNSPMTLISMKHN